MRTRKPVLTEQELEIMKIVWRLGDVTVRDVYEALLEKRKIAYTTVMTMMGILEEKGHLLKKQGEKANVFRAAQARVQVEGSLIRDLVNRLYDGSAKPLLVHLIESEQVSREELDEISKMLRKKRGGA